MNTQTYKKNHPPKPVMENDSGKPHQGVYVPQHPEKVIGGEIIYRSGWELAFAQWCDRNPCVVEWGGEPMCVQYRNPAGVDFDACKKFGANPQDPMNWPVANYYPDFYVNLKNDEGDELKLIIEIKPLEFHCCLIGTCHIRIFSLFLFILTCHSILFLWS